MGCCETKSLMMEHNAHTENREDCLACRIIAASEAQIKAHSTHSSPVKGCFTCQEIVNRNSLLPNPTMSPRHSSTRMQKQAVADEQAATELSQLLALDNLH